MKPSGAWQPKQRLLLKYTGRLQRHAYALRRPEGSSDFQASTSRLVMASKMPGIDFDSPDQSGNNTTFGTPGIVIGNRDWRSEMGDPRWAIGDRSHETFWQVAGR
jgi:hypothetical protein